MDSAKLVTFVILILVLMIVVNAVLTKVIIEWEPTFKRRAWMLGLLWFVPFIGAATIYKVLDVGWFKKEPGHKSSGAVSAGFLEIDAIFNPGSKHQVEAIREVKLEVRKEGETYTKPDQIIDLD
jgi:hypothetical protein